jgi:hypothetical protein
MIAAQHDKFVMITAPGAKLDDASATTPSIDTAGYAYCRIFVVLGDTDIAMAALKIQESDDDSTYADVTGLVYGTSADIAGSTSALPSATDDNKCFAFEVDLRGRKRYLDLVATAGNGSTGTYLTAFALLSRASDVPVTKTERGFGNILRV